MKDKKELEQDKLSNPQSDESKTDASATDHQDAGLDDSKTGSSSTSTLSTDSSKPGAQTADNPSSETTEIPPAGTGNAKPGRSTPPKKTSGGGRRIGIIAFILALCALLAAGWGYYKLQQTQATTQELAEQLQATKQAAAEAGSQAQSAEQAAEQAVMKLAEQDKQVAELQDRLTRGMKQISRFGADKRKDWLLAEVEYLLRLANQRVLMEKSPAGALTLLKSADDILRETDDVSIYNVRKTLAQDIAELEAVPQLDIDGVFLKLAALNDQVDKLQLLPVSERHQLPEMIKNVTPQSVADTWQQSLEESWDAAMNKLGQLVIIQQRDEPVEPLLSPEQVYFLQQNLHLMMEQAQLSLLQGHQQSYDASLQKASNWIKDYFLDDATRAALLKGLNEAKEVNVSPQLPDISDSLKALKRYLKDVHSNTTAEQGAG